MENKKETNLNLPRNRSLIVNRFTETSTKLQRSQKTRILINIFCHMTSRTVVDKHSDDDVNSDEGDDNDDDDNQNKNQ